MMLKSTLNYLRSLLLYWQVLFVKFTMRRITLILLLVIILFLPIFASAAGAYEKEILTTNFKATGRAFYALARVNAVNATGTYLRELQNDDSRTMAFIYNGCLIKCLYPPEDGWIVVELFNAAGVVRESDLSFDIEIVKPAVNSYHAVRNVVLSDAPKEANPDWHEVLQTGQQCTVLYESWPYPEAYYHYYLVETNGMYGYVPIDSIAKADN